MDILCFLAILGRRKHEVSIASYPEPKRTGDDKGRLLIRISSSRLYPYRPKNEWATIDG